jgi:hypothetical protein
VERRGVWKGELGIFGENWKYLGVSVGSFPIETPKYLKTEGLIFARCFVQFWVKAAHYSFLKMENL